MGMVVRSNIMALNANRQLGMNNSSVAKSLEKLSSGFRINRAGDDASGLAISEKMKAQIKGLETASMNSQDGISLVQTAEGALTEVHDMLNRMVELSEKSANGTMEVGTNGEAGTDRQALQDEMDQLSTEIERIARSTNFNNIKLLDGKLGLNTNAIATNATPNVVAGSAADFTVRSVGSAKVDAQAGKYVLDLAGMKIAQNSEGTLTIKAFGQEISVAIGGGAGVDTTSPTGAAIADIGTAVYDELEKLFDPTSSGTLKIDGQEVTATSVNGKITFTQTAKPGSENDVIDFSDKYGVEISYDGVGYTPPTSCELTVTESIAPVAAGKAHVDIALKADNIRNETTFTFADKTYTFRTKDSGMKAADLTANQDIDLLAYSNEDLAAMSDEEVVKLAAQALGKAAAANAPTDWKISYTDQGVLHADYTGADMSTVDTKAEILSNFSSSAKSTDAKLAITIDDTNLNIGDVITIDGQAYEFTNDANKLTTTGAKAVVVSGLGSGTVTPGAAADALAKALGKGAVSSDGTVTVSAKKTTDLPQVAGKGLVLQIGDTNDSFNKMTVSVQDMSTRSLFSGDAVLDSNGDASLTTLDDGTVSFDISSQETAGTALTAVKKVINTVSSQRAALGAIQNRLEHTINNLDVAAENMNSANSRIRDTDMAKQMMDYTKMNVLTQAAQAMLAQANQQPQSILQLLQ